MDIWSFRLPKEDRPIIVKLAKENYCTSSDIFRTMWQEFAITHGLKIA